MLNYSEIAAGDFDAVAALYEKYLNYGEGARQCIKEFMSKPDTFGFKATEGDNFAGMFILENTLAYTGGRRDMADELLHDSGGEPIWTSPALAVDDNYRGHGAAHKLIKLGLDGLVERGVHYLALDMWVYPDGTTPTLMALQYAKEVYNYGIFPDFYSEMYKQQIYCPVCGEHCSCKMNLFLIKI